MEEHGQIVYSALLPDGVKKSATGRRKKMLTVWSLGAFAYWTCVSEHSDVTRGISKCWNTICVLCGRYQDLYDAVIKHQHNVMSKIYGRKYYVWRYHLIVLGEKIAALIA